jgi:antitoxin ParD1/3/4
MASSYTIGPRFEALVRELVSGGRYNNASEVVRDGLRMVEERERKLAALDTAIEQGLADLDAGRAREIDDVRADILRSLPGERRRA